MQRPQNTLHIRDRLLTGLDKENNVRLTRSYGEKARMRNDLVVGHWFLFFRFTLLWVWYESPQHITWLGADCGRPRPSRWFTFVSSITTVRVKLLQKDESQSVTKKGQTVVLFSAFWKIVSCVPPCVVPWCLYSRLQKAGLIKPPLLGERSPDCSASPPSSLPLQADPRQQRLQEYPHCSGCSPFNNCAPPLPVSSGKEASNWTVKSKHKECCASPPQDWAQQRATLWSNSSSQ